MDYTGRELFFVDIDNGHIPFRQLFKAKNLSPDMSYQEGVTEAMGHIGLNPHQCAFRHAVVNLQGISCFSNPGKVEAKGCVGCFNFGMVTPAGKWCEFKPAEAKLSGSKACNIITQVIENMFTYFDPCTPGSGGFNYHN